jgi:dihydrofolate reductase
MRKLVLVVHTSLDGYVAGCDGELDGFDAGEENLEAVCSLTKDADAALFGRVSFQLLNKNWSTVKDCPDATWNQVAYSCWYNAAKKFVVSTTLQPAEAPGVTIIRENIFAEIKRLKNDQGKQILIVGSPTLAQSLIQEELVDEYWIFINPVIFGKGIALFGSADEKTKLTLLESKQFSNGEIALHFASSKKSVNQTL